MLKFQLKLLKNNMTDLEIKKQSMNLYVKIGAGVSGLVFLVLVIPAVLALTYTNKILPSLEIGSLQVGGQSEAAVRADLQQAITKLETEGIAVQYESGSGLETVIVPVEKIVDLDLAVATVVNFGKDGNLIVRGWRVLSSWLGQATIDLPGITVTSENVATLLKNNLAPLEKPAQDAQLKIVSTNPFTYEVSSSTTGLVFDYQTAPEQIMQAWKKLQVPTITVSSVVDKPEVTEQDVEAVASISKGVFNSPIIVTHFDAHTKRSYQWSISKQQLADWSQVKQQESGPFWQLKLNQFLNLFPIPLKK